MPPVSPEAAIRRHIARLESRTRQWEAISQRFSNFRLAVMGLGLPFSAYVWTQDGGRAGAIVFSLTFALFMGLVIVHRRYQAALTRFRLWERIKRDHLARLTLDWAALPASRFQADPQHPFELDLDLTHLHRLLDTSATRGGGERLWAWLRHPDPDLPTIQQRHTWIADLLRMPIFRDQVRLQAWLAREGLRQGREGHDLLEWLAQDSAPADLTRPLLASLGLGALNFILAVLWLADLIPPIVLVTIWPYALIYLWHRPLIATLFGRALTLSSALRQVTAVLGYLEGYRYGRHTAIRQQCQVILTERPSQRLRRVEWIVAAAGVQANPYLWLILNAFFPWDLLAAWQLGRQQSALAHSLPRWLEVWADLEGLCSLATFAALHPQYTFPHLQHADSIPLPLQAVQLGHPLIPAAGKVRNDVQLERWGQVWLITGSNMAGKSSFLRTIGVNLALAYAGSVVDADHLEVGLMRVYTSMRITDSLEDGISYFYAEVQRLKALLEALQDSQGQPLCFLIDEIFRGTNNRERLLGSRAYIRALLGGRGIGWVATHDLDLTQLEGVENYHFREEVREGRMVFDYRLRPGPCPTTNALTIMRLAGLPIPQE